MDLIGILLAALFGPIVLAAVLAAVMVWLSSQGLDASQASSSRRA